MGFVADAVSGIGNTVGNLIGMGGGGNSGSAGMNFNAQPIDILQPTNLDQTEAAYRQTRSGLDSQQDFLSALMAQNGIQNQSNVFGQQQALANQLQGVANGTGPNPALAQLNNTTGQNIANQAAMMAGQRGSQANVGLLGRQMAMQGGNLQQQAVGQGAALQAQQQLNAMTALQGQQNSMANVAGTQVGQQANAIMGYNQAAQNEQAQLLNALNQYNANRVNMQGNINNANANIANTTAKGQQNTTGSLLNAAGAAVGKVLPGALGKLGLGGGAAGAASAGGASLGDIAATGVMAAYRGGEVKHFAQGGMASGPSSQVGQLLSGWSSQRMADSVAFNPGYANFGDDNYAPKPLDMVKTWNAKPEVAPQDSVVQDSGNFDSPMMFQAPSRPAFHFEAAGGPIEVPGQAKVPGNSLKNDIVPAMLSPHEIVLPRSVTMAKNAPEKAKQFVAAIMAKKKREGK